MCGIWALIRKEGHANPSAFVKYMEARGPEGTEIMNLPGIQLGFTRLAINGLNSAGMQPFHNRDGTLIWMCNGEIYNWRELAEKYGISTNSGSDCEVLGELYQRFKTAPSNFFQQLDGVFAMVIVDYDTGKVIVGRDPYGVRPLFFGLDTEQMGFASEAKGLVHLTTTINQFPPGHWWEIDLDTTKITQFERYHATPWIKNPAYSPSAPEGRKEAGRALRFALEEAVRKRLMTERPVAALLSGGIDSSLIAALVQRELKKLGKPALETFSIGFEGSPDLYYARKVAEWIGSNHNEILVTPDDFFRAVPDVIWAIESYDITSVRASIGNWMVAKAIRNKSQAKVVFNGDGSDEVFGSYKYFAKAPGDGEFEAECRRLLEEIHFFDGLRSDRSISCHGLEPRTPFLDKQFVAVALGIATEYRRMGKNFSIEKGLLREAFSIGETQGDMLDGEAQILPNEVLWRKKEAFSDGVSKAEKSWHIMAQEMSRQRVPVDWKVKAYTFYGEHLMPETEEAYYYRSVFHSNFGSQAHMIPHFWLPRWCGDVRDPSAREIGSGSSGSSGSSVFAGSEKMERADAGLDEL